MNGYNKEVIPTGDKASFHFCIQQRNNQDIPHHIKIVFLGSEEVQYRPGPGQEGKERQGESGQIRGCTQTAGGKGTGKTGEK